MNAALIEDTGHPNPMTIHELETRMRGWLATDYTVVLFGDTERPLAYALYRDNEGRGIYLRQFFVARDQRRTGVGRTAYDLLVREVFGAHTRVVVDVLSANARALSFWRALGFTDYATMLERLP